MLPLRRSRMESVCPRPTRKSELPSCMLGIQAPFGISTERFRQIERARCRLISACRGTASLCLVIGHSHRRDRTDAEVFGLRVLAQSNKQSNFMEFLRSARSRGIQILGDRAFAPQRQDGRRGFWFEVQTANAVGEIKSVEIQ